MPADVSFLRRLLAGRQVCAWCDCDLGPLPYPSRYHSYGICPTCTQRHFADLYDGDEDRLTEGLQERVVDTA